MEKRVEIRLLGGFSITALDDQGQRTEKQVVGGRKKVSLLTYLILQAGQPVPTQRLIRELWSTKHNTDSAASLKTTVNRLRSFLNETYDGLGACVCSGKGTYSWQSGPDVYVDVLEFEALVKLLKTQLSDEERDQAMNRLLDIYQGDLIQTGDMINGEQYVCWLHRDYLEAVYAYVKRLKECEAYNDIVRVCQRALQRDALDEFLRIELMRALVSLNRPNDATAEYRQLVSLNRRLLDEEPGDDVKACYRELAEAGQAVQFNLDAIRNELLAWESERRGPFFCDYAAFEEIYHIQMRNLERLGSTMFLGVIMVQNKDDETTEMADVRRESAMAGLQEIIRRHLRKGDIVTRFSPNIYAMLLPTVNYSTGSMVMERIEQLFYDEYPKRNVTIHHRISPLGGRLTMENA